MAEIITLDDLKGYLEIQGSTRDAKLGLIASGVNEFVANHTKRDWSHGERTDTLLLGRDSGHFLVHYPVKELLSLTVDHVVIAPAALGYVLEPKLGLLYRSRSSLKTWRYFGQGLGTLVYMGGPEAIPADLKLAALEMAAYTYRTAGGVTSIGGLISVSYLTSKLSEMGTVAETLDHHRDERRLIA